MGDSAEPIFVADKLQQDRDNAFDGAIQTGKNVGKKVGALGVIGAIGAAAYKYKVWEYFSSPDEQLRYQKGAELPEGAKRTVFHNMPQLVVEAKRQLVEHKQEQKQETVYFLDTGKQHISPQSLTLETNTITWLTHLSQKDKLVFVIPSDYNPAGEMIQSFPAHLLSQIALLLTSTKVKRKVKRRLTAQITILLATQPDQNVSKLETWIMERRNLRKLVQIQWPGKNVFIQQQQQQQQPQKEKQEESESEESEEEVSESESESEEEVSESESESESE